MPANTSPIFLLTADRGVNGGARLNGANTTRDLSSTSNASILFSGGTNGSRIDAIDWVHSSSGATASVPTIGRLFQCADNSFSNPRLLREISLPAITPNQTTTIGQTATMSFTIPLFLPFGYSLVVTLGTAQNAGNYYDVTCYGGDY
jgi:hypothetical protein